MLFECVERVQDQAAMQQIGFCKRQLDSTQHRKIDKILCLIFQSCLNGKSFDPVYVILKKSDTFVKLHAVTLVKFAKLCKLKTIHPTKVIFTTKQLC